jgi:site-specific DNA recombinase
MRDKFSRMTTARKRTKRPTTTANRRAVIYVRISRDREEQHSTESQERACRAYAESQGWTVVAVEIDQGKGAWEGKKIKRPAFDRAMNLIDTGIADVLLVWALDRAARSTRDLDSILHRLSERDAAFASATQPIDTTTPMGIAMIKIIGVLAELESAMKSERMVEHHHNRRMNGHVNAGPRTYGYQRVDGNLVIDKKEAKHVRRIYDSYLAGGTLNGIARMLNAENIPTANGKNWFAQSVRAVIVNPTYAGLRDLDGVIIPGNWTGIVTREKYEEVQAIYTAEYRPQVGERRRHLLTGLFWCGICQSPVHGGADSTRGVRYRCSGAIDHNCFNGVAEDTTDKLVVGAVLANIDPDRWADIRASSDGIDPTIALRAQLETLALDVADGRLTTGEWQVMRPRLLERIAEAEAKGIVRSELPDVPDIRKAWDSLDIDQQRAVLSRLVTRVELLPSPTRGGPFRPERIVIH